MSEAYKKTILGKWATPVLDGGSDWFLNPPQSLTAVGPVPIVKIWEEKYNNAAVVEVTCPPTTTKTHFSLEALHFKFGNTPDQMAKYVSHYVAESAFKTTYDQVFKAVMEAIEADKKKAEEFKQAYLSTWAEGPVFSVDQSLDGSALSQYLNAVNASKYYEPEPDLGGEVSGTLINLLPNITTKVKHPPVPEGDPGCGPRNRDEARINAMVVHLNDHHKWSREQIADWLDTLDVDLTFKTPEGDE